MNTERVVISFDNTKPHWAKQQGLDKEAERLGMTNVTVSGDFDEKIARIYGEVEDFDAFYKSIAGTPLDQGTLSRVESAK